MKITKIGHCCLLIEEKDLRILTDPGNYSTKQNELKNIDVVLITHEHADHLHLESLKQILTNNPQVKVFTNSGVGKVLKEQNIAFKLLEHGQKTEFNNVVIEAFGEAHAYICDTAEQVKNTGYLIDNKLFYPGDALYNPGREVEILALPIAGPWIKLIEAINYGKLISPKKCFPVHDGGLNERGRMPFYNHMEKNFSLASIEFFTPKDGEEIEF
jgi:L-ascorbate metabolism protein UlaG (beta-lactamase superfamily)